MSHEPAAHSGATLVEEPPPTDSRARGALACVYALILPKLQAVAHEHGYALAVHGSLMRDLDLIAAPWTDDATDHETLALALCAAVGGKIYGAMHDGKTAKVDFNPVQRPHGRKGWVIHIGGPYLDVSIMPRLLHNNPVRDAAQPRSL